MPVTAAARFHVYSILTTCFALGAIVLLWLQNYGRAYLYDYSLLSYANGYLERGMHPYRDFGTPLQSLPYYLSYWSECIFGRHYLSLAYANLLATLAMFVAIFAFVKRSLPYVLATLFALCGCIATTLQHAVLWYNPFGTLLLVLVIFVAFDAVRRHILTYWHLAALSLLLILTGTLKLNFHAANIIIVGFCLTCLLIQRAITWRLFLGASAVLAVSALILPIACELLINHASLHDWTLNVIVRASGRKRSLRLWTTRNFWVRVPYWYYPGEPFRAVFLVTFFCYGILCVQVLWPQVLFPRQATGVNPWRLRLQAVAGMGIFFFLTMLLAVTNVDISSISEVLLPIGLLAVFSAFQLPAQVTRLSRVLALALAVWLGVAGVVAIRRHSRLCIPSRLPVYGAGYRVNNGYMKGMLLAKVDADELAEAEQLLMKYKIGPQSDRVYWGPGLEMFSRQFQTVPLSGFPLWYSPVTIREGDVPGLIRHFQDSPVTLFIADSNWFHEYMPGEFVNFLNNQWIPVHHGSLVAFVRPQHS